MVFSYKRNSRNLLVATVMFVGILFFYFHFIGVYSKYHVVTNNEICTKMCKRYIERYENITAIELFIVASTCEGVVHPMDSGLGGGFQLIVHRGHTTFYVNARERAGSHVSFAQAPGHLGKHIGIPSMLAGYQFIYNHIGALTGHKHTCLWKELFTENAKLAIDGSSISMTLQHVLLNLNLLDNQWELSANRDKIMSPLLGKFIKRIAENGPYRNWTYYTKDTDDQRAMLRELTNAGSAISATDLQNYRVKMKHAHTTKCLDYKVSSTSLPGSGILILFACKMLEHAVKRYGYLSDTSENRFMFRIHVLYTIYSMQPHLNQLYETRKRNWIVHLLNKDAKLATKRVYRRMLAKKLPITIAKRVGSLKLDMSQVRENVDDERGTSNICIRDKHRTIVCATSTINWSFGTRFVSQRFGFLYNNQLADFTYNNQKSYNRPRPNRYPRSSISPTIFLNAKDNSFEFSLGAAGGRKIIASNFIVLADMIEQKYIHKKTYNCTHAEAQIRCTFHVKPNKISAFMFLECEDQLDPYYKRVLYKHKALVRYTSEAGYSSVTMISKNGDCFDQRRGGGVL